MRDSSFEYPKGVRFTCQRCSRCCGDTPTKVRRILLLPIEANRVSVKTGMEVHVFTKTVSRDGVYKFEVKKRCKDGKCVLLDGNRCTIYAIRPLVCRFYPFQLENSRIGLPRFPYAEDCPGVGKGVILTIKFFNELFQIAEATMQHATA